MGDTPTPSAISPPDAVSPAAPSGVGVEVSGGAGGGPGSGDSAGPPSTLTEARGCVRCAYNLQGLPIAGKCPECGTPIVDSLKGILLQHADAVYLGSERSGIALVLNSILLMVVLGLISVVATVLLGPAGGGGVHVVAQGIMLIPSAMAIVGYWKYSEPDLGFLGQEKPDSARNVLRIAVAVQAVLTLMGFALGVVTRGVADPRTPLGLCVAAVSVTHTAAWLVQFISVLRYTRWMARRVPDAFVVKQTGRYQWLLPVITVAGAFCFGLGPLIALVMYWNLLDRMRKHVRSIQASGGPAALANMA